MKTIYIYPGTFSPPTLGHLHIVEKIAKVIPRLIIICSKNPNKESTWFSPKEAKYLWNTYKLPKNVKVMTIDEFIKLNTKREQIIMIRGIRNKSDYKDEGSVLLLNKEKFGIDKFLYVSCDTDYAKISSTQVRGHANSLELESLHTSVSPLVISALLEKVLNVKNIFLVVGRPGSGKSTLLKIIRSLDINNKVINTDDFNRVLLPRLKKKFGNIHFFDAAVKNEELLTKIIAKPWMKMLKETLKEISGNKKNIFIEIPFGLQNSKKMFRFVGGKVIYIGCKTTKENEKRIKERGTPQLSVFIKRIPGKRETIRIIKDNILHGYFIDTSCELKELKEKAKQVNIKINKGKLYDNHI